MPMSVVRPAGGISAPAPPAAQPFDSRSGKETSRSAEFSAGDAPPNSTYDACNTDDEDDCISDCASGFVMLAAAELFGTKMNLELTFPHHPSIVELKEMMQHIYGMEKALQKPEGVPSEPFAIAQLQVYDEASSSWKDLTSAGQLSPWAQVYASQEVTPWHTETCQQIPPPQKPMSFALPDAPSLTVTQKVEALFREIDVNNDGCIDLNELSRCFKTLGIHFASSVVENMYLDALPNEAHALRVEDLTQFAKTYPTLIDCMYYRTRDFWEAFRLEQELESSKEVLKLKQEQHNACLEANAGVRQQVADGKRKLEQSENHIRHQEESAAAAEANVHHQTVQLQQLAREMQDHTTDAQLKKEKAEKAKKGLNTVIQEALAADHELAVQKQELKRQQQKEQQLAEALESCRREIDRQNKFINAGAQELKKTKQRVAKAEQGIAEAARLVDEALSLAQKTEDAHQRLAASLEDAKAAFAREQASIRSLNQQKIELEQQLHAVSCREAKTHREAEQSAAAVHDHRDVLQRLSEDHQLYTEKRKEMEAAEQPLLDQEVALKEQRDSIARRESQLRADATGFFKSSGRTRSRCRVALATQPLNSISQLERSLTDDCFVSDFPAASTTSSRSHLFR
ncbi:calmodulin-like protein containing EF hand domain [Diplonema papillatum]|nr:calmodulin-like protein containing EF hand domain [Diplonema papillatum]